LSRIALFGNLFILAFFGSILTIDYNHSRYLFAPPDGMVEYKPVQREVDPTGTKLVDAPELMNDTYLKAVVQVLEKDGVRHERHGSTLYISADFAQNRDHIAAITEKAKNLHDEQKYGVLGD
jgi:hypothetical protein